MNDQSKQKRQPKTVKEQKFVVEYAKTLNATEAAYRAYDVSSRESARAIGAENLAKLDLTGVLQNMGLDTVVFSWYLKQGLMEENPYVKFKYVELLAKLLDLYPQNKKESQEATMPSTLCDLLMLASSTTKEV